MSLAERPTIRPGLLEILICPRCGAGGLSVHEPEGGAPPSINCPQCRASYGFAHGMPLLYKDDFAWAPKQRESEGWVAMWKDIGLYDQDIPVDPHAPLGAIEEPWLTMKRMFLAALFQMGLHGGERVLDIGAGEGWAAQHFALRGAEAVAIDVVADMRWGLGRSYKRMAITGRPFDLLVGDNENLPFAPNSFDFVFSSNTLHHHDHLDKLFANIYRVLKPGGRLIAVGDPLVTVFQQESDATDGDREKSFGIIERRRRFYEYGLALWRAGFRPIRAEDDRSFWQDGADLYAWMDRERPVIEQHAPPRLRRPVQALAWLMLRLPRPFALALLLSLRPGGLLLVSARKP